MAKFDSRSDVTTLGIQHGAVKLVVNRTFLQAEWKRAPMADFIAHAGIFKRRAFSDAFLLEAAMGQDMDAGTTCSTDFSSYESGSNDDARSESFENTDMSEFNNDHDHRADSVKVPDIPMIQAASREQQELSLPLEKHKLKQQIANAEASVALAHAKLAAERVNLKIQTHNTPGLSCSTAGLPYRMGVPPLYPGFPCASGALTTLLLRNLPNNYSRDMVLELLDSEGFKDRYDFFYLPYDFNRHCGLGYAFVNMLTSGDAQRAKVNLSGFRSWTCGTSKVLKVEYTNRTQGLVANIERFRNSAVMHPDVPEQFKPLTFHQGWRMPFPHPTCKITPPTKLSNVCKPSIEGNGDRPQLPAYAAFGVRSDVAVTSFAGYARGAEAQSCYDSFQCA